MKLLLENWKRYLNENEETVDERSGEYLLQEAIRDRETTALARETVLVIKSLFEDAAKSRDFQSATITGQVEFFEYVDANLRVEVVAIDEVEYIMEVGLENLKARFKKAKHKTGILDFVDKLKLVISLGRQDGIEPLKPLVSATGGSWDDAAKQLNLYLTITDVFYPSNKEETYYGWIGQLMPKLKSTIQHELEHTSQESDRDGTFDTEFDKILHKYNLEIGYEFNTKEKILRATKGLMEATFVWFQENILRKKDLEKSEYSKVYNQALVDFADDLKVFRELTPDNIRDDELILYYLQPIEIEAYVVGFYREARERIKDREWVKKNIQNWEQKSPRKRLRSAFEQIVFSYRKYVRRLLPQAGIKSNASIKKVLNVWIDRIIAYAEKRFPMLSDKENIGSRNR